MSTSEQERGIDYVRLVLERWRVLLICASLGAAAGITYALLAPQWFSSTLTVVPSQRREAAATLGLAAKLPESITGFATDLQKINTVLTSTTLTDAVIEKFDLTTRFGTSHPEHTREAVWGRCRTAVDKKAGLVRLTCEDKDPQFAMQLATAFGEIGNRVFARISTSSAGEERKFLEAQVAKSRMDIDQASQKLRDFQAKHKIIDLPEQSKAVISAMASIQGELLSKELEVSYLSSFSARTESSVVQLQQQIAIMRSKLSQLESSVANETHRAAPANAGSGDFFPDAMKVPALRYELEQLLREQKIQETVYALLTQRYEMAKLDEARNTSTFQILDSPTLPTIRSRPRRRKVALAGLATGFALGLTLIVVPVWWRRRLRR